MPVANPRWRRNGLLAALSPGVCERLRPHAESLSLAAKQVICEPGGDLPHVYFPAGGIISLVDIMADGMAVEVVAVGRDGLVGLPAFLGSGSMPTRAFVQVSGDSFRISSGPFRAEFERGEELFRLLLSYTEAAFNQVARSAACNRVHGIRERCARWLLATHDGVGEDRFELTQEFLAQMLGVRRAAVNGAAGGLQRDGMITYARGRITIVDRAGLEAAACECYGVIRAEYRRLLGPTGAPRARKGARTPTRE